MADAKASDGVHDEAGVAGERPPRSVGGANHVGQVAGTSGGTGLNSGPRALAEAAGVVQRGDEMSRRISADGVEVCDSAGDIGHGESVVGRPGAGRKSSA